MNAPSRDHAEALALMIEHGLADARDATSWACTLVAEQASPSDELIELAGAIRPHPLDIVRMLRCLDGALNSERAFRLVLRRLHDHLVHRPSEWPRVTLALEQMALHGEVPGSLAGPCYGFDDERLLAEQGICGNAEQVRDRLMAFLDAEAAPPPPT